MYNEISQAQSKALLAKLTMAAESGTLTEQQLSEAVRVHVDGIDGLFSVGLLWMRKNIKHLGNCAFNLPTFLINHLDAGDFGSSLIHSSKVLKLVPEADRALVYKETFIRCGDCNSSWVREASQLNVPKETVAAMILERLQKCKIDPTVNGASFVHDFLRYGAGRVEQAGSSYCFEDEQHTYWAVLTNDQLTEALKIVIERAPSLLFEETGTGYGDVDLWLRLSMRLGSDSVEFFMEAAALKLTSLSHVSLEKLTRLSPLVRLQVARTTGGSAELAVNLALTVGIASGGEALLTEFEALFTAEGAITAFRSMWTTLQRAEDQASATFIEHWLLRRAEANGYFYGQVQLGSYFDRTLNRKVGQLRVKCEAENGHTYYVQDRNQRDYLPQMNDWVFIRPASGRRLTPRVVAVTFTPARLNKK